MSTATGQFRDRGAPPSLLEIAREWGRLGCIGFGGPLAHIALLSVKRRGWLTGEELEDAIAACNLLPGPASTQLAIFCAWRLRGRLGGLIGGLAFILPGLALILGLAVLFLAGSPPLWVNGAGAGAGAAIAAVALRAGLGLLPASWPGGTGRRVRWLFFLGAGAGAAATIGPWLVLVLLGCGLLELGWGRVGRSALRSVAPWPIALATAAASGGLAALSWVAIKVGALSYGGGFVIVPLMQADAVHHYHG